MLVSMFTRRSVYSVAHYILFMLLKSSSSDCVLPLAWSTSDVHGNRAKLHCGVHSRTTNSSIQPKDGFVKSPCHIVRHGTSTRRCEEERMGKTILSSKSSCPNSNPVGTRQFAAVSNLNLRAYGCEG